MSLVCAAAILTGLGEAFLCVLCSGGEAAPRLFGRQRAAPGACGTRAGQGAGRGGAAAAEAWARSLGAASREFQGSEPPPASSWRGRRTGQRPSPGPAGQREEAERKRRWAGTLRRPRIADKGILERTEPRNAGILPGVAGRGPQSRRSPPRVARALMDVGSFTFALVLTHAPKNLLSLRLHAQDEDPIPSASPGAVSEPAGAGCGGGGCRLGWDQAHTGARAAQAPPQNPLPAKRPRPPPPTPPRRGLRAGAAPDPCVPGRTGPQTPPRGPGPEPRALPGTRAVRTPRCAGLARPPPPPSPQAKKNLKCSEMN